MKLNDRQFRTAGEWALASDGIQWILQRQRQKNDEISWRPVAFVRSTRDILARCIRERNVPAEHSKQLLAGLPPTFDEWLLGASRGWSGASNATAPSPARAPLRPSPDQRNSAEGESMQWEILSPAAN